jgi:hypothetical protein
MHGLTFVEWMESDRGMWGVAGLPVRLLRLAALPLELSMRAGVALKC